jgi:hypothetical protein
MDAHVSPDSPINQEEIKNPAVNYSPDIYYHIGLAYCMMEKFEKSIYPFTRVS